MVLSDQLGHAKKIALLNDSFRTTFVGGTICVTAGLSERGEAFVKAALLATRSFTRFDTGNDPYHEHDFGSFSVEGEQLFFKIDYYDPSMLHGSDDPSNITATRRVLTVMLAEEY